MLLMLVVILMTSQVDAPHEEDIVLADEDREKPVKASDC
jgi:hypothetical protein